MASIPKTGEWISSYGADTQDPTYFYVGYCKVGTTNWRIQRIKKTDFSMAWAGGKEDGATNWNNRTSLTYSTEI